MKLSKLSEENRLELAQLFNNKPILITFLDIIKDKYIHCALNAAEEKTMMRFLNYAKGIQMVEQELAAITRQIKQIDKS